MPSPNSPQPHLEPPQTIIQGPGGLRNLGVIESDAATVANIPPGPIVLQEGYPGQRGWGWRHVTSNPERVGQIKARGFATPLAYACAVAANWTLLHEGEGSRIAVVWPKGGFALALALEWKGAFWSITTMLPFRAYNRPTLYEKRPDGSDSVLHLA